MINISSAHLRNALLFYYRFKRGYNCVDEVYTHFHEKADVLVDTKKHHYEIEIKTSKSDLRQEKKKKKHKEYLEGYKLKEKSLGANKFYICVPTELITYAEKWIQEVNQNYGLIEFLTERYENNCVKNGGYDWEKYIRIRKNAKYLHQNHNTHLTRKILNRLSSALCNAYVSNFYMTERG